jgi:hypothetical protein
VRQKGEGGKEDKLKKLRREEGKKIQRRNFVWFEIWFVCSKVLVRDFAQQGEERRETKD